jgi:CHAT domain-containing protein
MSIEDARGVFLTAYNLGYVAKELGDAGAAAQHWEQAAAAAARTGDRRGEAAALFAVARDGGRDLARARDLFARALQLADEAGDVRLGADTQHSWADHLFVGGVYDEAIERLLDAARRYEQLGATSALGTVYNSLGRLYRAHGQNTAALEAQRTALAFHEQTRDPRTLIQSLNAVAVTYHSLGDMAQARAHFERAIALAEESGLTSLLPFLRGNFGDLLMDVGDLDRGRQMIAEAALHAGPYAALRHAQLSRIHLALGRRGDALAAADTAVTACPAAAPADCLRARSARAGALLALGRDADALADLDAAVRVVEDVRARLAPSDFLKQGFSAAWEALYTQSIELKLRQAQVREALETTELARARSLLDLLASRDLPTYQGRPRAALPLRGPALTSDAVASTPDVDALTRIAARLKSTMLLYWVGDAAVNIWVLQPDGRLHAESVPVASTRLNTLIRSLSPSADEAGPAVRTRGSQLVPVVVKSRAAWTTLYDLLIAPIASRLPRTIGARLTIVPHGPLLQVPFAALRDPQGRYLVERYSLHAVTSAAVLEFTAERRRTDARTAGGLIVGDPTPLPRISGEPPLERLPGAREEARAIARLLPTARTTLLEAATAPEAAVRAAAPRRSILHFATHAIVRDSNPLGSFLALGSGKGSDADGQLTAEEIYRLDLDADLVVLSACRSGGGAVASDGVAALARAFFYAGTASIVVSVWDVVDAPTSQLLPAFYRSWLGGADKDRALRAAQLRLIADLRAGKVRVPSPIGELVLPEDPIFWAGFVLLGEPY